MAKGRTFAGPPRSLWGRDDHPVYGRGSPQRQRSAAPSGPGVGEVSGGLARWATIQAACHSSGSNTASQGNKGPSRPQVKVRDAPGDDQVKDQGPFQSLQGARSQRLDPAARFPGPEKISTNQRRRYQSMSCTTASSASAGRFVNSRQSMAFSPAGGCSSRARIAVTVTTVPGTGFVVPHAPVGPVPPAGRIPPP